MKLLGLCGCTKKFDAPLLILSESMHNASITNSGFQFGLDFIYTKTANMTSVWIADNVIFYAMGIYREVILHLCHSDMNRIWPVISVQFIILCHVACLSQLSKFYIVDYDISWFDSSWERSFLRLPNNTITEWKQHHALGLIIEMVNDEKKN
jgi:hypothetical protein